MKLEEVIRYIDLHLEWCNKKDCSVCKRNNEAVEIVKQLIEENTELKERIKVDETCYAELKESEDK